jgi:hypothetical protein
MKPIVPFRQAIEDPKLLGPILHGESWATWRAVLISVMGEKLTDAELTIFRRVAGDRADPPASRTEECAFVVGRRGGKDRAASVLATYIAGLCDHGDALAPGERGVCLLIAPDQRQATVQLNYIEAAFRGSPMLSTLVESRISDTLRLSNGIDIEVRAAHFRRIRGLTCVAVVASECAFWHSDDAANADTDILTAVRPSLATTQGPLILISTPYARRGELWEMYRRYFGAGGDPNILVVQGAARDFNPTLPQSVVDRALERDHAAASAEYLAIFRSDIESFVTREAVQACISLGVRERPPVSDTRYYGFADPSGGSSDSFTLAIGHREDDAVTIDLLRERKPPFSPEAVVAEFSEVLKAYGVNKVVADKYGGEWPAEQFRKFGIVYEPHARPKSDLYQALLPALNSGRIDLLDEPRSISQLCSLERRTSRAGKDSIDHPPGAHDDVCNAIAGCFGIITHNNYSLPPFVGIGAGVAYMSRSEGAADGKADADAEAAAARERERAAEEAAERYLNERMAQHIAAYGGRRF